MDASALSLVTVLGEDGLGNLGEIKRLPLLDAALTGGQREEGLDEPLLVLAEGESFLADRPQGVGVGVRVGEGDFEEGLETGEGGA